MGDSGGPIQLCLVNNDPTSTLLMTPAGQPLYSVITPISLPEPEALSCTTTKTVRPGLGDKHRRSSAEDSNSPLAPQPPRRSNSLPSGDWKKDGAADCHVRWGSTTIVKRLDDYDVSRGHVESTIGLVKGKANEGDGVVVLELCELEFKVEMPAPPSRQLKGKSPLGALPPVGEDGSLDMIGYSSDGEWVVVEDLDSDENSTRREALNSWDFIGPDKKHYKWQMLVHAPVLARIEQPKQHVHIARFRRPKIGIVSRPRKGYLEIYPNGNVSMDLIVTSFVAFMKQCVLQSEATIGPATSGHAAPGLANKTPTPDPHSLAPADEQPGRWSSNPAMTKAATPVRTPVSLPPRFVSAVALARKHSRSPPESAFTFPPFLVKPKIRPVSATGPGDSHR